MLQRKVIIISCTISLLVSVLCTGIFIFYWNTQNSKDYENIFSQAKKKFCYVINDLNKLHYLLEIVEGNYESGNQQLIADYQNIANKMNFQLSILKIISITNPKKIMAKHNSKPYQMLLDKQNGMILSLCHGFCVSISMVEARSFLDNFLPNFLIYSIMINNLNIIENKRHAAISSVQSDYHTVGNFEVSVKMYIESYYLEKQIRQILTNGALLFVTVFFLTNLFVLFLFLAVKKFFYNSSLKLMQETQVLKEQLVTYKKLELLRQHKQEIDNRLMKMIKNKLKRDTINIINTTNNLNETLTVNIKQLLTECIEYFALDSEIKGISIKVENEVMESEHLNIDIGEEILRQLIFSLTWNLLSILPKGSHLKIKVKQDKEQFKIKMTGSGFNLSREQFENYSFQHYSKANNQWLLSIKDTIKLFEDNGFSYEYIQGKRVGNKLKLIKSLKKEKFYNDSNVWDITPHLTKGKT